jgi:hypothetical protein
VHIGGLYSARDLGPPRDGASQHRSQLALVADREADLLAVDVGVQELVIEV